MSAVGVGSFDNDGADDLIDDLVDAGSEGGPLILVGALMAASQTGPTEYLEKQVAEPAVAAAALVGALASGDTELLEERGVADVMPSLSTELTKLAILAVERVMLDPSELLNLWIKEGRDREWLDSNAHIIDQLR